MGRTWGGSTRGGSTEGRIDRKPSFPADAREGVCQDDRTGDWKASNDHAVGLKAAGRRRTPQDGRWTPHDGHRTPLDGRRMPPDGHRTSFEFTVMGEAAGGGKAFPHSPSPPFAFILFLFPLLFLAFPPLPLEVDPYAPSPQLPSK